MTTCTCADGVLCPEAERLQRARDRALTEYALHPNSDEKRKAFYEVDKALTEHRRAVYRREGLL